MITIKNSNERFKSFVPMIKAVCNIIQPKLIIEYGPGLSTNCFLSNSSAIIHSWDSNSSYYSKYKKEYERYDRVNVYLGDTRAGNGKKTPYVNAPIVKLGCNKADVVFVDGRFRADCMIAASLLVKEAGVVILHDDERPVYQKGNVFPHSFRDKSLITGVYSKTESVINNIKIEYQIIPKESDF
jgi:hypothetical protein